MNTAAAAIGIANAVHGGKLQDLLKRIQDAAKKGEYSLKTDMDMTHSQSRFFHEQGFVVRKCPKTKPDQLRFKVIEIQW
jgi:hypothetical protein